MGLSDKAKERLFIATTDKDVGTEIASNIDGAARSDTVVSIHDSIDAGSLSYSVETPPIDPVAIGPFLGAVFNIGDIAHRTFKINSRYVGNPSVHLHWTKSTDAVETGRAVRWRVTFLAVDGHNQNALATPGVVEIEDTYDDSGTTSRIIYRTPNLPLTGVVADYYLAIQIERVAPVGTPLSASPLLISADLRYDMYVNK